jgi:hypothetical protein
VVVREREDTLAAAEHVVERDLVPEAQERWSVRSGREEDLDSAALARLVTSAPHLRVPTDAEEVLERPRPNLGTGRELGHRVTVPTHIRFLPSTSRTRV